MTGFGETLQSLLVKQFFSFGEIDDIDHQYHHQRQILPDQLTKRTWIKNTCTNDVAGNHCVCHVKKQSDYRT